MLRSHTPLACRGVVDSYIIIFFEMAAQGNVCYLAEYLENFACRPVVAVDILDEAALFIADSIKADQDLTLEEHSVLDQAEVYKYSDMFCGSLCKLSSICMARQQELRIEDANIVLPTYLSLAQWNANNPKRPVAPYVDFK